MSPCQHVSALLPEKANNTGQTVASKVIVTSTASNWPSWLVFSNQIKFSFLFILPKEHASYRKCENYL